MLTASIHSVCNRLGVIEEEREEDERKLSVAIAAAERMNVLVRGGWRDIHSSAKRAAAHPSHTKHASTARSHTWAHFQVFSLKR